MDARAARLIEGLALSPHPEGGFFREIHRSASAVDPLDGREQRAALTVIYYLLAAGQVSRWHRVASDETWHFHEGSPLELHQADANLERAWTQVLGPSGDGSEPVRIVRAGTWQASRSSGPYVLVSCSVGPGFDFADFQMLRESVREAETLRLKHPHLAQFL